MCQTLPLNASNKQKITHLEAFAETITSGTYLRMLFNPDFMQWVTGQITSGCAPDLYDFYQGQMDRANRLDQELKKAEEIKEALDMDNATLRATNQDFRDVLDAKQDEFEYMRNTQIPNRDELIATLRSEITTLKARLYDHMTGNH